MRHFDFGHVADGLYADVGYKKEVVAMIGCRKSCESQLESEEAEVDRIARIWEFRVFKNWDPVDGRRPFVLLKIDDCDEVKKFSYRKVKQSIKLVRAIFPPDSKLLVGNFWVLIVKADGGKAIYDRIVNSEIKIVSLIVSRVLNTNKGIDFYDRFFRCDMVVIEVECDKSELRGRLWKTKSFCIQEAGENIPIDCLSTWNGIVRNPIIVSRPIVGACGKGIKVGVVKDLALKSVNEEKKCKKRFHGVSFNTSGLRPVFSDLVS